MPIEIGILLGLIVGVILGIIIAKLEALMGPRLAGINGQHWHIDGMPNYHIHQLRRLYVELGNLFGGHNA